jgi:hypothetical protein
VYFQAFNVVLKFFAFVALGVRGQHFSAAPAGWIPNACIDGVFPDGARSIVCNELLKELIEHRFCPSCHCVLIADRFATRQNSVWCHFRCPCCNLQQSCSTLPNTTVAQPEHLQSTVETVFSVLACGQHYKQYKKFSLLQGIKPIAETTFFNIQKAYCNSVEAACSSDQCSVLKEIVRSLPASTVLALSWDFQWSQRSQAFAGAGHLVSSKHQVPISLGKKNLVVWSKSLIKKHSITLKGGKNTEVVQFFIFLPAFCDFLLAYFFPTLPCLSLILSVRLVRMKGQANLWSVMPSRFA